MTDRLEKAVAAVRRMPAAEQDTIAQAILSLAQITEPLDVAPEHVAAMTAGLDQADRGVFVEGDAAEAVAAAFGSTRSHIQPTPSS
ncbi:acetyltransferase [Methylobacterium sp. E-005]|uniref:acetyltransferase n=1 Tax=Methylobacterium sp. E-005 TaxID=2836549 RepID=UPI001FB9D4ED|nr:acetyltransferase [Methylobacterium sp. E-005]MCJ2089414.1 acetyltransferase [Methylobacterium sp. E-005]